MTKDSKKNRTEKDFVRQGAMLKEVSVVLNENGFSPILSDGVVLGIIREGDFIPWDFDADFFIEAERAMGKEQKIADGLKARGFEIITVRGALNNWKVAIDKHDYHIDIRSFFRVRNYHISKVRRSNGKWGVSVMPARFMDNLQEIEFRGGKYLIPRDTEGYLTHLYGPGWRMPVRSVKQKEYLSRGFKTVEEI